MKGYACKHWERYIIMAEGLGRLGENERWTILRFVYAVFSSSLSCSTDRLIWSG